MKLEKLENVNFDVLKQEELSQFKGGDNHLCVTSTDYNYYGTVYKWDRKWCNDEGRLVSIAVGNS